MKQTYSLKNLFYCFFFLSLFSCVTDEGNESNNPTTTENNKGKFSVFTKNNNLNAKSSDNIINYPKGFAILMQKYDSVQKTNLTGLVNSSNTIINDKQLQQNFIIEDVEPYVETRIYSQTLTDEEGNKTVFFPKVFNNKVVDIFIARLSEEETQVNYYRLNKNSLIYESTLELFQKKYDTFFSKSNLNAKSSNGGFDCGYGSLPACGLGEVVIRPYNPNPGGGGLTYGFPALEGGGGCKAHEMCACTDCYGGGGSESDENINSPYIYRPEELPPSCKTFEFKQIGSTNYQEAGVKNIYKVFIAKIGNGKSASVAVIINQLYFGLPIERFDKTVYSSADAAHMSAKALKNAFDKTDSYFKTNPHISDYSLAQNLINNLNTEMGKYKGHVSRYPSSGSNPPLKDYRIYWFIDDPCRN